jgi:Glycosyl transferase family 2
MDRRCRTRQWLPDAFAIPAPGEGPDAETLSFRYDPVVSAAGEFVLWCRMGAAEEPGGEDRAVAAVRTRWFTDDGRVLVWQTESERLEIAADGLWRPLRLDAPLQPRGSRHLRFEIAVRVGAGAGARYCGLLRRRSAAADWPAGLPADAARGAGARPGQVTVVVTSCGRQDLLERTLQSFFRFNTFPIGGVIVVEDGPEAVNAPLFPRYGDRNVVWLSTGQRVGQIVAIDFAYSLVDSEYIFHLEDDWEFYGGGFIEKSMALLQALPRCLQVYLRAPDDLNGQPLRPPTQSATGLAYRQAEVGCINLWHGFSFNPGLRRTADYRLLARYSRHVRHDGTRPGAAEAQLSALYRAGGYYAVVLADNEGRGYVRHIGGDRHVD